MTGPFSRVDFDGDRQCSRQSPARTSGNNSYRGWRGFQRLISLLDTRLEAVTLDNPRRPSTEIITAHAHLSHRALWSIAHSNGLSFRARFLSRRFRDSAGTHDYHDSRFFAVQITVSAKPSNASCCDTDFRFGLLIFHFLHCGIFLSVSDDSDVWRLAHTVSCIVTAGL